MIIPRSCFLLLFNVCFLVEIECRFSMSDTLAYIYSKASYLVPHYIQCKLQECCDDEYVRPDIDTLDEILEKELYGQDIVRETVVSALRGHIHTADPVKALAMSFHGAPGTGKTHVTNLIAQAIYKKGTESSFYHFYNGRNDFPLEKNLHKYQEELREVIVASLGKCGRSMFVFDEVDKMPEGLLNVLVPFLDYNAYYSKSKIYQKNATYIFLSNTGSGKITGHLLDLWLRGHKRLDLSLVDFENLIPTRAFNEKGGFHHSDAIQTSVIDHYVPFLPLEEQHVKKCVTRAFNKRGVSPNTKLIQSVMSYVIFGPEPHNMYAVTGCKRLEQKVASLIYAKHTTNTKREL